MLTLAVAACQQRKRVRFTTAAELINELIEAQESHEVSRAVSRWMRYELIVLDELCYVAMPEPAAELLFQVIAGRAERAAVMWPRILPSRVGRRLFRMRGWGRRWWSG